MNNAPSSEAGRTNPKTEEKAQANEYFQKAHRVSQPYRMRRNQMGKQGPVEAHRSSVDVTPEVSLKTAWAKPGPANLYSPTSRKNTAVAIRAPDEDGIDCDISARDR
jgi:hypothetical protein